jgi:hypothetical protein
MLALHARIANPWRAEAMSSAESSSKIAPFPLMAASLNSCQSAWCTIMILFLSFGWSFPASPMSTLKKILL